MANNQRGFTLIEALIAFIVLVTGTLSVLLFQATLLKDSSDMKVRQEALKIAESWIESRREYVSESQYASVVSAISTAAGSSSTASGSLNTYTVTNTIPEPVSGAANTYKVSVNVTWPDESDGVSLTTYFSWLDPQNILKPELAGGGSGSAGYSGDIPLPTGTLTALSRDEITEIPLADILDSRVVKEQGDLIVYDDGSGPKVAIKLANNRYVQLASLNSEDNEIMTLSGRIYNNIVPTASEQTSYTQRLTNDDIIFGDVYRALDGSYNDDNILDVLASAGANCVVTNFGADDSYKKTTNPGKGTYTMPSWADYLCVAGTGWNGQIELVKRDITAKNGIGVFPGEVCSPRLRAYRYAILETENLTGLQALINSGQVGSTVSITDALSATSTAVVGQSGLVRFYKNAALASDEGVVWSDYFWHNPYYLYDPAGTDSSILGASSSENADGYKVPNVVSSATESLNYPGDVAHQNFLLADDGYDCATLIGQYKSNAALSAPHQIVDNEYRYAEGMPGYDYKPGSGYDISDYNTTVNADQGNFVLGYALAEYTLAGTLYIPEAESPSNFELIGNPAPIISITCDVGDSVASEYSGFSAYSYTCSVPRRWTGSIVGYYLGGGGVKPCNSLDFDTISGPPSGQIYDSAADLEAAYPEAGGQEYIGQTLSYYYTSVLGYTDTAVTAVDFDKLLYQYIGTAVIESTSGDKMFFDTSGICAFTE